MIESLTQKRLKELMSYDPITGVFKRLKYARKDGIVGWSDKEGYLHIRLEGVLYLGHRLAWLYVYGMWPKSGIDHKNRTPADNWIMNLREADQVHNMFNAGLSKANRSGRKGVSWDRSKRRWRVTIQANGKWKQIGRFKHFCLAIKARRMSEISLHGDFRRSE